MHVIVVSIEVRIAEITSVHYLPVNQCVHLNVNEDYHSHSSSPFALIKYSVEPQLYKTSPALYLNHQTDTNITIRIIENSSALPLHIIDFKYL